MNCKLSWLALAAALILAACSSGNSSSPPPTPPPPAAVAMVNGAVVDNFIFSSTVTAFSVSSAGVVGACIPSTPATTPAGCATATSDSGGNYSVNLGSYSGAVLLQATGGTYTDTVTGQAGLAIPASLTLSVLVPAVSPSSTATVAQITPLTTMAAQLALQQAAQGTALTAAISSAQSEVATYFGGLADIVGTAIADLSKASCPAATNQAIADASLVLDGVAELASQYKVTSDALFAAILEDAISDDSVDALDTGTPITVPLAAGGGSVALSTIYGSSLALSLKASIASFQASALNVCNASASTGLQGNLGKSPPSTMQSPVYNYTVNGTYTLSGQFLTSPQIELSMIAPGNIGQTSCPGDVAAPIGGKTTVMGYATLSAAQNQPFSVSIGSNPLDIQGQTRNWNNSCGTIQASISIAPATGQSCSIVQGPSGSMTFNLTDVTKMGDWSTITEGTNTVIQCSINVEAVTGSVSNLASGTTLTVTVTDNTTSANGSTATLVGSGASPQPLSFVTGGQPSPGVQYNDLVTVAASVTQATGGATQSCAITGQGTPSTPVTAPLDLTVTCATTGGGGGPSTAINSPQGMVYDANGHLWVANNDGSTGSVLEFSVAVNGSNQATALNEIGRITTGVNNPTRLAFDAAGNLYVTNIGNNNVTIYETADSSLSQIGTISNGTNRPLGIAVDTTTQMSGSGYVYVANNSNSTVTVFSPPAGTLSATNNTFTLVATLSGDGAGNPFSAPGALTFFATPAQAATLLGVSYDVLFVGLGPSSGADSVLMYKTLPLQSSTLPFFDLNNGNSCSSGPSGPTALAVSLDLTNAQHPLMFYVANYYSNSIAAYDVLSIIKNPTLVCPAPAAVISGNGSNIAQPEGMAVDAFRNIFVSDSSANHITVYNPGGSVVLTYSFAFIYSGGT
jgi:hypothetical protein